jgi:hypothetical protein
MTDRRARGLIAAASGAELVFLGCVLELAPFPEIWARMQAEHVATADGLCAAPICGRPGYRTPVVPWPCTPRSLADWAQRAHARR